MVDAPAIECGSIAGMHCVDRERYALTREEIAAYADRLRLDVDSLMREHGVSLGALRALQFAHLDRIAYETTGMHAGEEPPVLDPHESARRLAGGRGGYCFIIVDAYAALLTSLGFSVSLHVAAVAPEPVPRTKWGNHVLLVVHALARAEEEDGGEAMYVSDVGLGDGPRAPFRIAEGSWHEPDGETDIISQKSYRYSYALSRRRGVRGAEWRFTHDRSGSFEGFTFRLSSSCTGAHEFLPYHEHLWMSPSSPFRRAGVVAQRVTANGVKLSLRNGAVRRVRPWPGRATSTVCDTMSWTDWSGHVEKLFLLRLEDTLSGDQQRRLWQLVCAKSGRCPGVRGRIRRWLRRAVLVVGLAYFAKAIR